MREDTVELYYTDLHVEFEYGPMDWETGRLEKDFDEIIEYSYPADKTSVEEVIGDLMPDEEYERLVGDSDNDDAFWKYIEDNFDELFEKYEDKILEAFRKDAEEYAAKNYDLDYYDESLKEKKTKMNEDEHTFDIYDYADKLERSINGPRDKWDKMPKPIPTHINIANVPYAMRLKVCQATVADPNKGIIDFLYYTYDPFTKGDARIFMKEVEKALPELAELHGYKGPLTVNVTVKAREGDEYGFAKKTFKVRTGEDLHEDFDPLTDIVWDPDLLKKLKFLREHRSYDGQFSRDVRLWDLDLTAEQEDYYGDFLADGGLIRFWEDQENYAKDIFQVGRQGGHLVLGNDSHNQPTYYDATLFWGDLTEIFAEWVLENEGVYLDEFEDEDELDEVKERFIEWLNEAYEAVEDFDERVEHLIAFFKEALDDYIEDKKKPSEDLTETLFSPLEDIEEPELSDEEFYSLPFAAADTYLVENSRHEVIGSFDTADEAIDYAKEHFRDEDASRVIKSCLADGETGDLEDEIIWTAGEALEWGEISYEDDYEDDFDESYKNASDELPKLEEVAEYNPDFDDDFGGHHYTSYDLYRMNQELEDEEAFSERDPDRYDEKHAKEWMKKHPNGWYNSESDYGVGDEDFDESWDSCDEEDDEGEPFESYYVARGKNGEWLANFDLEDDAIEFAKQDERAVRVDTQTVYGPKIVWTREKGAISEKPSKEANAALDAMYDAFQESLDTSEIVHWAIYNRYGEQIATAPDEEDAIDYAMSDPAAYRVTCIATNPKKDRVIWTRRGGRKTEEQLDEGAMSDLDIEIQENGYDELIDKIERDIEDLEREERFLTKQAPREIGRGGNFDSQEDIDSALTATRRELEREKAKLAIVRGRQNG